MKAADHDISPDHVLPYNMRYMGKDQPSAQAADLVNCNYRIAGGDSHLLYLFSGWRNGTVTEKAAYIHMPVCLFRVHL